MGTKPGPQQKALDRKIDSANQSRLLREARRRSGLTMQQLADRIGVDISMVSRLESGERQLQQCAYGTVRQLCAVLGIDPPAPPADSGRM